MRRFSTVLLFAWILFLMVFAMEALAGKVKINDKESACCIRSEPSSKGGDKTMVGVALTGQVYEVIGEKVPWIKAEIKDVKRGEISGWIGAKILETDKEGQFVGGGGCTLRTAPRGGKSTEDGFVWQKSRIVKVLDRVVSWYKIKVNDDTGWICAIYADPVKEKK